MVRIHPGVLLFLACELACEKVVFLSLRGIWCRGLKSPPSINQLFKLWWRGIGLISLRNISPVVGIKESLSFYREFSF